MKKKIGKYYFILFDIIAIIASLSIAFLFKYGLSVPNNQIMFTIKAIVVLCMIKILTYKAFSLYTSLWEFASVEELIQVVGAVLISNVLGLIYLITINNIIPISVYLNAAILEVILIGGIRFSYRVFRRLKNNRSVFRQKSAKNVLIIGAGETGRMIAKQFNMKQNVYGVLRGFIDDDIMKIGKSIYGIKVLGDRNTIIDIARKHKIDEIILAIPSVTSEDKREILKYCTATECELKTVPDISEIINCKVSMNEIRDIEIEDLLGRDAVNLEMSKIQHYIENKTILVTGGGGSIGSELCRQITRYQPKHLIILDIYENNAYEIQNELKKSHPELNLLTLIASVRDKKNIDEIFQRYQPEVVFHAAAHKHVPLMETAPREAVLNNCFGTLNVVQAAHKHDVGHFVLISTDKAVNPTNVMGASKRICEMIIQSYSTISKTKFSGVRFGNVLGSNGSVIPLFKKQIKQGGPITVTHKDIIRYFMTISEAAQLVLQSGAYAKGGELFVLDMGKPMKIYKLAEDLIRLSGYEPHVDIDIKITGLRPGEKLYEELLMQEEGMQTTPHKKIFIGRPICIDNEILMSRMNELYDIASVKSGDDIREYLMNMVPTYRPTEMNIVEKDPLKSRLKKLNYKPRKKAKKFAYQSMINSSAN